MTGASNKKIAHLANVEMLQRVGQSRPRNCGSIEVGELAMSDAVTLSVPDHLALAN
jgi:hypothetical protein